MYPSKSQIEVRLNSIGVQIQALEEQIPEIQDNLNKLHIEKHMLQCMLKLYDPVLIMNEAEQDEASYYSKIIATKQKEVPSDK